MLMDVKRTFEIGKIPLLAMVLFLLAADLLYSAGLPKFSVVIFPIFLVLTAYFAHGYGRDAGIGSTAVASVVIANSAIILEGILFGILLLISMVIGVFPELTLEAIVMSVVEAMVIGIALFSMISALVGAVMWVVVRKIK